MSFPSVKIRELSGIESQNLNMHENFQTQYSQPDIHKADKSFESQQISQGKPFSFQFQNQIKFNPEIKTTSSDLNQHGFNQSSSFQFFISGSNNTETLSRIQSQGREDVKNFNNDKITGQISNNQFPQKELNQIGNNQRTNSFNFSDQIVQNQLQSKYQGASVKRNLNDFIFNKVQNRNMNFSNQDIDQQNNQFKNDLGQKACLKQNLNTYEYLKQYFPNLNEDEIQSVLGDLKKKEINQNDHNNFDNSDFQSILKKDHEAKLKFNPYILSQQKASYEAQAKLDQLKFSESKIIKVQNNVQRLPNNLQQKNISIPPQSQSIKKKRNKKQFESENPLEKQVQIASPNAHDQSLNQHQDQQVHVQNIQIQQQAQQIIQENQQNLPQQFQAADNKTSQKFQSSHYESQKFIYEQKDLQSRQLQDLRDAFFSQMETNLPQFLHDRDQCYKYVMHLLEQFGDSSQKIRENYLINLDKQNNNSIILNLENQIQILKTGIKNYDKKFTNLQNDFEQKLHVEFSKKSESLIQLIQQQRQKMVDDQKKLQEQDKIVEENRKLAEENQRYKQWFKQIVQNHQQQLGGNNSQNRRDGFGGNNYMGDVF